MRIRRYRSAIAALAVGAASAVTFGVVSSASAGTVVGCDATASISDAAAPTTPNGQVPETDEGNPSFPDRRRARFKITLDRPCETPVTVSYSVTPGTAEAGSDYEDVTGSETFNPGETAKNFNVLVIDDIVDEDDETFTAEISSSDVAIGDGSGAATIIDDDTATLSIDDVTEAEGTGGTNTFVFTVSLTPSENTVTVNASTAPGTAQQTLDYVKAAATLTFLPGDTSETFTVKIKTDSASEPDEVFFVNLGAPTNATIGDGQGVGTIQDDDSVSEI